MPKDDIKAILSSQERAANYARLQKDINIPFVIDYDAFKKSPSEKEKLYNMKKEFERNKRLIA